MAEQSDYAGTAAEIQTIEAPQLDYLPPRMKGTPPKIGLIGCGGITEQHLIAYRDAGYDVVAMSDKKIERAQGRRDEFFPNAKVYEKYADLLADPRIVVVDIATHPAERAPLIRQAILAGKHVLSQKPFVVDLKLGKELADLADKQGVKLAVNQNGRWAPHVSYMRQAINAGLIGDVTSITTTVAWNHNWTKDTPFNNIPHLLLYDFAIHWFDMANCYMTGRKAQRIYAATRNLIGQEARPDLGGTITIEYPDALVSMHFDANTRHGPRDETLIVGTKGALHSQGPDLTNQTLTLTTEQGQAFPDLQGAWFSAGFDGTMSELLVAIEEDRQPSNNPRHNMDSLALAFAAMDSAQKGQPVTAGSVTQMHDDWLAYPESPA